MRGSCLDIAATHLMCLYLNPITFYSFTALHHITTCYNHYRNSRDILYNTTVLNIVEPSCSDILRLYVTFLYNSMAYFFLLSQSHDNRVLCLKSNLHDYVFYNDHFPSNSHPIDNPPLSHTTYQPPLTHTPATMCFL